MTKLLKIISVILSLAFIVSCFGVSASAADVNYTVTNVSGKTGDTVTVAVKISSAKSIWGANVMLGYNNSELQYVSCSTGDSASSGSLHNTGSSVNYSGMFANTNGTIFTVKFKILKSSGTSLLKLTSTENIDSDGKTYECSTSNGAVTVLEYSGLLGDANGDGKVSSVDARTVLQHVARLTVLDEDAQKRADVDGDGNISATDARRILQYVAGLVKF